MSAILVSLFVLVVLTTPITVPAMIIVARIVWDIVSTLRTIRIPRKVAITVVVLVLIATQVACGIGGGGTCEGLNDADCNTPGVQTVSDGVVNDILNAAANANGDGQADVAPCGGIVC